MVFSTDPVELNICRVTVDANIAAVTDPASPDVTKVPVTLGIVIVLSAVGLSTVRVVSWASSADPSNITVPLVVSCMPEDVTAPVSGPANAVAVTVPVTSNAVDGDVLSIPILDSDPSIVITMELNPPSLTLNDMSVFWMMFERLTPVPSTVIDKSLSAPMVMPESVTMPSVPVVVSLASDLRNDAAAMLPSASALVAVPWNFIAGSAVDSVIPFLTVAKPGIELCGVNSVSEIIANNVPSLYHFVMF